MSVRSILSAVLVAMSVSAIAQSAEKPPSPSLDDCSSWPRMHALDFWLGTWRVSWQGRLVGTNRVEVILKGCAVMERWRDVEGGEGQSVFYYDRATDRWKQVWLTDHAFRRGGTKEKVELKAATSPDRIRFQGSYPDPESGVTITDRTTLTREADGTLRHVIEISTDGGKSWRTAFDGVYRTQGERSVVVPAKAGTHVDSQMDSRLRGNDDVLGSRLRGNDGTAYAGMTVRLARDDDARCTSCEFRAFHLPAMLFPPASVEAESHDL